MSRQIYYAESLGESTVTGAGSDSYQDKTTLTFTPDASTDYIIFWSADVIALSTADDLYARLYNSTDAVVLSEQNQENRTTGNTPYRMAHGFAKYSAGASPASTSFKIQYRNETTSITAKIRNARILAVRVESDDEYAESLGDQAVTSNSYVDGATLTFTPASQGDYLVFASCDWNHGSTADIAYIHLLNPSSTSIGEMQHINRDATNYNPYTTLVKENLTASSKTYKIQIHRTSTNTITVRNQRLFAMRLDTFANTYYAEDRTRATTTSTTYQDDNSLTQTTNAADHLIFNVAGGDGSSNGTSNYLQFLEDGNVMAGPASVRVNVTGTYSNYYTSFVAYKATLTNASHTWKRQFKTDLPATAGIDEDATAVLELSSGTTYNDTLNETISVSDSESAVATIAPALSESIAVTDSESAAATFVTTISDSIALSDSMSGGLLLTGAISEAISTGDAVDALVTYVTTTSDAITATDSNDVAGSFNAAVDDTISLDDANGASADFVAENSESILLDASFVESLNPIGASLDTHDGWRKRKKAQKLLDEARRRREQEKLQDIQDLRQQLEAAFNPESEEEPDLTPEQAEQRFQQVAPVVFDFKDDGFAKLAAAELQLIQRLISKLEAERQDEEDFAELVAMGVI